MAKAKAKFVCATCGKEVEVEVTGRNSRDAWERAAWAAENYTECSDCYYARKRRERGAEREAEREANLKAIEGAALPELTGSEKQIKWATDIRAKFYADFTKKSGKVLRHNARAVESITDPDRKAEALVKVRAVEETYAGFDAWLRSKASSSWWIDRRGCTLNELLNQYQETK